MRKRTFLTILMGMVMAVCPVLLFAEGHITVTLSADSSFGNPGGILQKMESNLGLLLTQINEANSQKQKELSLRSVPMNDFALSSLTELWKNVHFYCDDNEVFDRCWPMKNGYMVRQIPLILDTQDDQFNSSHGVGSGGVYQEAVVEFDKQGRITDFRLTFDSHQMESMERCGNTVTDIERKMLILSYCDRFRTAYCTKDLPFLQQVFSDDALIITGKVIRTKPSEVSPIGTIVEYNRQTKKQYLANLANAFRRNKYIDVKFTEVGSGGSRGCGAVTQSRQNPNMYGVRLRQEWRSSRYSDDGYVFLIWDFTDEQNPVIHVRTWQPEYLDSKKTQHIEQNDIFSLSDFSL